MWGWGEVTFLTNGFLSPPPRPTSLPPKTFVFWDGAARRPCLKG